MAHEKSVSYISTLVRRSVSYLTGVSPMRNVSCLVLMFVFIAASCQSWEHTDYASMWLDDVVKLAKDGAVGTRIDQSLITMANGQDRVSSVKALFGRTSGHPPEYLALVRSRFLDLCKEEIYAFSPGGWPLGLFSKSTRLHIDLDKPTMFAIQESISENSDVLRELMHQKLVENADGIAKYSWAEKWYLEEYARNIFSEEMSETQKFAHLLDISVLFGRPEILLDADCNQVDRIWRNTREWLNSVVRYSVYDAEAGVYVVDDAAMKRQEAVNPQSQRLPYIVE